MNKKSLKYRNGTLNKKDHGLNASDHAANSPLLDFFGKISVINPLEDQTPQEFKPVSFRRSYGGKQSKKM